MRASILCVGTELTDGQIINRNAPWLSVELKKLGFRVDHHLCIPDTHSLILESLRFLSTKAELLFVTGGLGPTSDDFTRDVIAEWVQRPQVFNDSSWQHVTERLQSRGLKIHDFQRQQCFFPEGSTILPNSQGTANGFRLELGPQHIIVLPGPPREIQAVWNDGLYQWLKNLGGHLDPVLTKSWDTLGLGESMIAALVEPVVQGQNLEIGYRVHHPYVEVKASFKKSLQPQFQTTLDQIENVLAPSTVVRDGQDLAQSLAAHLQGPFEIVDQVSGGFLLTRLQSLFTNSAGWTYTTQKQSTSSPLILSLTKSSPDKAEVCVHFNGQTQKTSLELPEILKKIEERGRQYFAEMALLHWLQLLKTF